MEDADVQHADQAGGTRGLRRELSIGGRMHALDKEYVRTSGNAHGVPSAGTSSHKEFPQGLNC